MLSYQPAPRRTVIAVVMVRDAAADAARRAGGIPNLLTDIFKNGSAHGSTFTDELAAFAVMDEFIKWGAKYGPMAQARALAAIGHPSAGYDAAGGVGGRSAWPHAAWLELQPEGSIPVTPIPGVEVIDLFYPDETTALIGRRELSGAWLWLSGAVVGAFVLAHVWVSRRG